MIVHVAVHLSQYISIKKLTVKQEKDENQFITYKKQCQRGNCWDHSPSSLFALGGLPQSKIIILQSFNIIQTQWWNLGFLRKLGLNLSWTSLAILGLLWRDCATALVEVLQPLIKKAVKCNSEYFHYLSWYSQFI